MPKVLLSFLGTGEYKEIPYALDGQEYLTPYTQEALARHYPQHTLKVLLTDAAQKKHGEALRNRVAYEGVSIPDGRTEEELWQIFNAIVEAVPEGASLVVDISHGFRSQPVLALAVVHFLNVAKGVQVERILYGALREQEGRGEFLDLTAFLELLAWTQAARDLAQYGFGKPLGGLLQNLHRQSWLSGGAGLHRLGPLGKTLENLSLSLEVLRVQEASQHAIGLLKALEEVEKDLERAPRSRPLGLLLRFLEERYAPLAVGDPLSPGELPAQAAMVELLLNTGSLAQAAALMRELMVTWLCLQRGFDPVDEREGAEGLLNSWARRAKQKATDEKAQIGQLWNDLANLRNDIAHAGMRKDPTPAQTLAANLKDLWQRLRQVMAP
ncbi:TIGR02221 family CRISPR-associated protein [Thermus sp.]|uniref:TIGR02221 family CRISPR-associated protein n=1 Tax=Thermus sp. TaxID=275 RepID=UPI00260A74BE|nr:TIGR02221 family CRISPR-associated protein [Thermus sp.]